MSRAAVAEHSPWTDAMLAASLFAIDPSGLGGVAVRALPGPVRDRWLTLVRDLLPPSASMRRIPLHVTDGRLLGGLDLAATLKAGRPVVERGVLAEADGGVVVLAMAERVTASTAARLVAVLDSREIVLERDGLALRTPTRFGTIALDEGITEDERPSNALLDRLAFPVDLTGIGMRDVLGGVFSAREIDAARARLEDVEASDEIVEALCAAAFALGVESMRASLLALRAARAAAALAGRSAVSADDAALAGRLVFAPRATVLPIPEQPGEQQADDDTPAESQADSAQGDDAEEQAVGNADRPLRDRVLEAAQASIPPNLLAQLRLQAGNSSRARTAGRAGALRDSTRRGRPAGVRRGELRAGARLNVVETLRAAAPWQRLRRRDADGALLSGRRPPRIEVRRDDFRITRFKHREETTAIFVVDASGSSALHRLAEAKGAVELILADCYVRRDRVALLSFRGGGAELLLPPTRSLVRAKRSLASLPGGGGTPLAAGIDAAVALADMVRRRGETPTIVLLTDGRANVARDGSGGRAHAEEDALAAARNLRAAGLMAILVDTSPRPQPQAGHLAAEMRAVYLPLPQADAAALSRAIRASALPS